MSNQINSDEIKTFDELRKYMANIEEVVTENSLKLSISNESLAHANNQLDEALLKVNDDVIKKRRKEKIKDYIACGLIVLIVVGIVLAIIFI